MIARGQLNGEFVIAISDRVRHDNQAAIGLRCKGRDRTLDFCCIVYAEWEYVHCKRRRSGFRHTHEIEVGRYFGIVEESYAAEVRGDLLEQFQPLATHRRFETGESGDVAAGPGHAHNQLFADRIGYRYEYDRYRVGFAPKGHCN